MLNNKTWTRHFLTGPLVGWYIAKLHICRSSRSSVLTYSVLAISCWWETGEQIFAWDRTLSNVIETCRISHLAGYILRGVVEYQVGTVRSGEPLARPDLIFPLRMHWLAERIGAGVYSSTAWFAVMGDGNLQPSENHALWNSKPSLYYFKYSKTSGHGEQCWWSAFINGDFDSFYYMRPARVVLFIIGLTLNWPPFLQHVHLNPINERVLGWCRKHSCVNWSKQYISWLVFKMQ